MSIRTLSVLSIILFLASISFAQEQDKAGETKDRPLRIISKPRPAYTDEARQNNVQGTVKLEITFQFDGTVGEVVCVNEDNENTKKLLEFGLVAAFIEAAKKITFEPELKNGEPITVKKKNEYTFSIY